MNREQELENRRSARVPLFGSVPGPSVDQAQTNLSVTVQIRVDPVPERPELDHRRSGRVIGRKCDVEEEESVLVRRSRGADDHRSQEIDPAFVDADED